MTRSPAARAGALSAVVVALAFFPGLAAAGGPAQVEVFRSGAEGYHTFRIPSAIATPRGGLLAFAEARKAGRGDSGDVDLALKRSDDEGATWGPLQLIADDGEDTVGNPCPVVDRETGTIWLLLTKNLGRDTERQILDGTSRGTRTVWVARSDDDGRTWSRPVDMTADVKAPDWTWYATGPGVGIQARDGRLVIPCDHFTATKVAGSHVILSDDHGRTWRRGGSVEGRLNECQVAELSDGRLVLNMRNHPIRKGEGRALAFSADGGMTWTDPLRDPALVEPGCQAGLIRVPPFQEGEPALLVFSNPAGATRARMTVRLSPDDGKTWPHSRIVHPGPSAYSCPVALPDGSIGLLYERGEEHPYETITFARFGLDWLTGE
jgi:sialidase-1